MGQLLKQLCRCVVLVIVMLPLKTPAQIAPSAGASDEASGITVKDARPKRETTGFLGFWSSDCDTGIWRLGDEKPSTSRLSVLQQDLRASFGDEYAGSTLLVTKYSLFVNMSLKLQASNPAAKGILGSVLVANNCTKEKTTDGWYSPDEVTTEYAPIIVEIEASLNDKTISARVVYSPAEDIAGSWGLFGNKAKGETALLEAIRQANAKLIEQIAMP